MGGVVGGVGWIGSSRREIRCGSSRGISGGGGGGVGGGGGGNSSKSKLMINDCSFWIGLSEFQSY